MSNPNKRETFLYLLYEKFGEIQQVLGTDWDTFKVDFLAALAALARERDKNLIRRRVDDLAAIGLKSSAASIFRRLLNEADAPSTQHRYSTRGEAGTPDQTGANERGIPSGREPHLAGKLRHLIMANEAEETDLLPAGEAYVIISKGRPVPRQRVVNTGFAPLANPDDLMEPTTPLRTRSSYFFWMDIGQPVPQSGERTPMDIPQVAAETTLTVALFTYADGFLLTSGADTGQLYLHSSGEVTAVQQPLGEAAPDSVHRDTRLFFALDTPARPGNYSLRCNIYCGQLLLQSRLVQVQVVEQGTQMELQGRAWESVLDYTLTNQMEASHLIQLEPNKVDRHKLSILLNENGDGTHSFHFFGKNKIKNDDVRFGEGELVGMITDARRRLHQVSWNHEDEWQEGSTYRYADRQVNLPRLEEALVLMAKWGCEFYTQIGSRLGNMQVRKLRDLMIEPGYLQIAMKESPNYILPVAMIYDYPFDVGTSTQYRLCPEFVQGLQSGQALEDLHCFNGQCPSYGKKDVVCPSGFWGFRHYIGMPMSVKLAPEIPPFIGFDGHLQMVMGEAMDLGFLATHEAKICNLEPRLQVQLARQRQEIFDYLKKSPHLVYFYCHGGLKDDAPYLLFGPKENPELVLPSNLVNEDVLWEKPRPLVFLNGCHTTAVDPLKALQFIRPLVEECQCAGVIGTEITIFEALATAFAEEFFRRLLLPDATVGKALRGARLKILTEGNPLGLVYIPFVVATLYMEDVSAQPIQ